MNIELRHGEKKYTFIQIFKNMNKFTEFVKLNLSQGGLYVEGLDATKSSIFTLNLDSEWFDRFNVISETYLKINCIILSRILQTCKEKEDLYLYYNDESDILSLSFKSEQGFNKDFDIPLVDLEYDTICVKEIDCDVEFSIETKILSGIMDDFKMFGDVLDVDCNDSRIIFVTSGVEGNMRCTLYDENHDDKIIGFSCVEDVEFKKSFSLKFMNIFCSFDKVCKEVNLQFTDDMPLKMSFNIDEKSHLVFYLAPLLLDNY